MKPIPNYWFLMVLFQQGYLTQRRVKYQDARSEVVKEGGELVQADSRHHSVYILRTTESSGVGAKFCQLGQS